MNPKEAVERSMRVGIIALAVASGCGGQRAKHSNETVTPATAVTKSIQPEQTSNAEFTEIPQEILNYFYPELIDSGLKARSFYNIHSVLSGIPTAVYNYTDYNLNQKLMEDTYTIFESMAVLNTTSFDYPVEGFRRKIYLKPNALNLRLHLVLPENAPKPKTVAGNLFERSALTVLTPDFPVAFSMLIKTKDGVGIFSNPEELLTANFAVETCNQVIDPEVIDEKGNVGSVDEKVFAKELVCNSFGAGVAAKLLGKSFEEYDAFIRARTLSFGPNREPSAGKFPFFPLNEDTYNLVYVDGSIVK